MEPSKPKRTKEFKGIEFPTWVYVLYIIACATAAYFFLPAWKILGTLCIVAPLTVAVIFRKHIDVSIRNTGLNEWLEGIVKRVEASAYTNKKTPRRAPRGARTA